MKRLPRRTLLRGLGTVAIGLPFLPEMMASPSAAFAADAQVPVRAFYLFFGLGMPAALQTEGFAGPMEPLKELQDKLLIMRGIDHVRADIKGDNAHYDGSAAAFNAMPHKGTDKSGGASIDQMIRAHHYPNGLPPELIGSLLGGTFFRRSRATRFIHSWDQQGLSSGQMQESPEQLFKRVFGEIPGANQDGRTARLRRSVLDSVVGQYQHLAGQTSPLGASSKQVLEKTLTQVREYERRAFGMAMEKRCKAPDAPKDSELKHGDAADPNGQGIDITLEDLSAEWRLLSEIYALAIRCDRARFGGLTFLAAGERIRLKGEYRYGGKTLFEFDDAKQHGRGGSSGCSHEWWHKYSESNRNEAMRAHLHMKMRELVYFMKLLDGPEAQDANGKSILENSLITISTESGDGRHSDSKRELSGIFHACTGAGGRLKTGRILDVNAEGLDLYNTILGAMGVSGRLGPKGREFDQVSSILA